MSSRLKHNTMCNDILILDISDIESYSYSDPEGVAVIMPCIDTQQGLKTADILQRRAGMPCKIIIANDTLRQGFIKTANEVFKRLDVKYVVYLAQDAFPGRDWLVLAYQTLEKTGKGLLAFNDGKWKGRIASFGMVRVQWVLSIYGGDLFYSEYKSHGADNELTVIARATNEHVYNPHCSLIEVDFDKDRGGSNPKDRKIFENRFINCFDHMLLFEDLEYLASEYNVNMAKNALGRIGESIPVQVDNTPKKLTKALVHRNWTYKHKLYSKKIDFVQEIQSVVTRKISIIVISWKFHPDTFKNFQILERQRNKKFELIFVDNGGKPGEFDELKPYIDTYVRLNTNTGAYLARNIGAIFSKAPILFFLDDDGIPAENIVKAHLDAHEKYDAIAVRGVCQPKTGNIMNNMAKHYFLGGQPYPRFGDLEGNISYNAGMFFQVGGWDDNIKFGHGGIDLSYRLLKIEPDMRKQIYSPDPVIFHDYAVDENHLVSKREKQSQSWQYLRQKHGPDFDRFLTSWDKFNGNESILLKKSEQADYIEEGRFESGCQLKHIENLVKTKPSLKEIINNTGKIIIIGNSSISDILGRPVDAVCPVSGNESENHQDYPNVISVESILDEIDPNEPVFIHSLYSRQIAVALSKAGFNNIVDITHESWRGAQMLDRDLITENLDSIAKLYDLLSDDESRNVLTTMLKFRITMDPRLIKCSEYQQYHHPVVSPAHGDCLLDGGAFTGDTVLDFSRTLQGNIKGVCFEPDKENFKMLEHNLYANRLDRKIAALPSGLWNKGTTLSFDSASQSSRIVEKSSNTISVIDIDTYCKKTGLLPDLIKLDVEGAEIEALTGGETIIKTLKPKMMVSAYHHGTHLWEIPLRLAEMGYSKIFLGHHPPEYTIYETVAYAC